MAQNWKDAEADEAAPEIYQSLSAGWRLFYLEIM